MHYTDSLVHGLSVTLVTDKDDISKLEGAADAYQGMNLQALAESTKTKLSDLNDTFINQGQWPPGTDAPSSYLFGLQSINSTVGYLVIPDLEGGRYSEADHVARTVLSKAHACVVLVPPDKYMATDAEGKRYREEVRARVRKCAEAGIPACVMITKADRFLDQSVADETHKQLSVLIQSHDNFKAEIFRVSVISDQPQKDQKDDEQGSLPKASERTPYNMVRAFVWVIDQALSQSAASVRAKVPELGLRRAQVDSPLVSDPIPELRKLGDYSGRPGIAVCAISPNSFLFLNASGDLVSASFENGEFATETAGSVAGMSAPTARTVAFHVAGEILMSPNSKTDSVWVGPIGDELVKVPLPLPVVGWAPLNARGLVAVDATGKLHSLRYAEGKWNGVDFFPDFINPSERLVCAFVDKANEVVVTNGVKTEAAQVQAHGKFGDRRRPTLAATYDGEQCSINRVGVFAGLSAGYDLMIAVGTKVHNMGATRRETPAPFALCPSANYVARLGPDMRLAVGLVGADQLRVSEPQYSPPLPKDPDSMVWSTDGQLLIVTFPDGTYSAFRPAGLRT
jgi:hypothetical protein